MKKIIKSIILFAISLFFLTGVLRAETFDDLASLCDSAGLNPAETGSFYFVQATDIHVNALPNDRHTANFESFTNEIRQMDPRPAFVIITGDAVESGQRVQYKALKKLVDELQQYVPVYISLGNHDVGWSSPANGAVSFLDIFGGRSLYGSFSAGGVRFAWLFPYPSDRPRTEFAYWTDAGPVVPLGLGAEQEKWLSGIVSSDTRAVVLFFHQPPGDVFGDGMVFGLTRAFSGIAKERKVWIICGHGHSDNSWRQDLTPEGYARCVMTPSLAYEKAYRLYFVKGGDISGIALKRLDGKFMTTGNLCKQTRNYLFGHSRPPVLLVDVPFDDTYILGADGAKASSFRSVKDSECVTYAIPVSGGAEYLGFCVTGQYMVEISDGETWARVAKSGKRPEYQAQKIVRLPDSIRPGKTLFIRFSDPAEGDRFGSTIAWFGLFAGR